MGGEPSEDSVLEATRRIGRLIEIIDGVAAAAEFDRRANKGATEIAYVGKLTVREGNPGDDAVNDWIAAMMGLYRTITGKEPATSVGTKPPNEGVATGPLIRFLEAAGKPLSINSSEDAWRSRVRTVLKGASIAEQGYIRLGMSQRDSTSLKSSQSSAPDALIDLVRLLARQAAREFVYPPPAPPDTSNNRSRDCK